jgi:hypothetical protein
MKQELPMKKTFLITTATAALLAGIGFASAQSSMERQAPSASEQKAAPDLDKAKSEINKSKGSEQKAGDQKGNMGAQNKAGTAPATNAQAPANSKSETSGQAAPDMKAQDQKSPSTSQSTQSQGSQSQGGQSQGTQAKPGAQNTQAPAQGNAAQGQTNSGTSTSATTNTNASSNASASINLNAEQKTKIRETVIKSSNAPRVANVNFKLSIGTPVPKTVRFAPLPSYLVEIQPAWRGYEYFLVGDEIVVVNPRTLEIVAILQV